MELKYLIMMDSNRAPHADIQGPYSSNIHVSTPESGLIQSQRRVESLYYLTS